MGTEDITQEPCDPNTLIEDEADEIMDVLWQIGLRFHGDEAELRDRILVILQPNDNDLGLPCDMLQGRSEGR